AGPGHCLPAGYHDAVPAGRLVGPAAGPRRFLNQQVPANQVGLQYRKLFVMLDPRLLRTETETVARQLAKRGHVLECAAVLELEKQRKALQLETEALQNERNTRSKNIGKAKAAGQDIAPLLAEVEHLREQLDAKKAALDAVQSEFDALLHGIPN